MPTQTRGGVPYVRRLTVTTTQERRRLPFPTQWLKLRNRGAAAVRIFFTEEEATAGTHYVEVPVASASDPYGQWEGPVEVPAGSPAPQITNGVTRVDAGTYLWLEAAAGSVELELVAFQRRG